MGKMKVHELAKELNMSNNEMIDKLNKLGFNVKSHLSALEDEVVEKVRKTLAKKEVKKSGEHKEQMHIIRRNVKVINTSGDKKEVEEISTSISGDIKKSHRTLVDSEKPKPSYNKEELGVVKPRQSFNKKPNFMKNRTAGVVITRNGKPIETQVKEEKKEEKIVEVKEEKAVAQKVEKKEQVETKQATYNKEEKNTETKRVNENRPNNKEKFNNRNNMNRNTNTSFNKDENRQSRPNQNNNNSPYNKRNRDVRENRDTRDNTSYQVNKFIKQTSSMPVEQKETKDYSNVNIDKKKYNENRLNENKKEKLDKNKLREKHSRVSTTKLRGMEINSDSGMLDLYENHQIIYLIILIILASAVAYLFSLVTSGPFTGLGKIITSAIICFGGLGLVERNISNLIFKAGIIFFISIIISIIITTM